MISEDELRRAVSEDAGAQAFVELAERLRRRGSLSEALEVCLNGLTKNPTNHQGRLVLARVFYDRRSYPFAVRELEALQEALPESKTIRRLLEKLAPGMQVNPAARKAEAPETVAETELEFDAIDLLEAEEEDKGK